MVASATGTIRGLLRLTTCFGPSVIISFGPPFGAVVSYPGSVAGKGCRGRGGN